jgi:hypothetical protein
VTETVEESLIADIELGFYSICQESRLVVENDEWESRWLACGLRAMNGVGSEPLGFGWTRREEESEMEEVLRRENTAREKIESGEGAARREREKKKRESGRSQKDRGKGSGERKNSNTNLEILYRQ